MELVWIGFFAVVGIAAAGIGLRNATQKEAASYHRQRTLSEIRRDALRDQQGYRERCEARVQEVCDRFAIVPGDPAYINVRDHAFDYLDGAVEDDAKAYERLHSMLEIELLR